ncbi:hypothetical protein BDV59DRAFT_199153 [Aspergillus ambiguus]|uniref:uncharacterized protein n=1 Tax=Aspergillus ambiguus TaxID=176160 RepID=UPI003CCCEC8B
MPTDSSNPVLPQVYRLTISLRQALSLMRALFSLKFLQGLDSILMFSTRTQHSTVAHWNRRQIPRQEQVITDICLDIIPALVLRTANKPDVPMLNLHSASSSSTENIPLHETHIRNDDSPEFTQARGTRPTRGGLAIRPAQHSPRTRVKGGQDEVDFQLLDSIPGRDQHVTCDSIYSAQESSSTACFQSRSSTRLHQTVPLSAAQYERMIPQTPWFSTSRSWSIDSVAPQLSGDSHAMLKVDHLPRSASSESFPGKFPVSDGTDYSFLATPYGIRGCGMTSVRPFSEV